MGFSGEQRKRLLLIARKAIEYYAEHGEEPGALKEADIDEFDMPRGVFVTLKKKGELRGCIGFPLPVMPLGRAVVKAAIAAAFEDYRFGPVSEGEMGGLEMEISVLTVPEPVRVSAPEEYLRKVKIGRDGLIIEYRGHSGLLLPQVPAEEGWGVGEYMGHACMKAGLPPNAWMELPVSVKAFQAEVFGERK